MIYALVLIVIVTINNAPVLKPFKEKISLKNLIKMLKEALSKRKNAYKEQANIKDDDAAWNRIPSKIDMDAVLSVDVIQENGDEENKKEDK